jgi:hypothetical protein
VLAIEPASDNGGDEELGAVARETILSAYLKTLDTDHLRVGTSVGHRKKSRLGVPLFEVLVGELLTVDGLATSALYNCKFGYDVR